MIKETMSICELCFRHITAQRFYKDGGVWLGKNCPVHGYSEHLIECDENFYKSLQYNINDYNPAGYVVEITDRCNLTCPHCYQMPDNRKVDKTLETIVEEIKNYPNDGISITLAGAEPTMRKDLFQLIKKIKELSRSVNILTNGVRLEDSNYVSSLIEAGTDFVTIGLNHPNYQGQFTHDRQLRAIENCVAQGLRIKNINYTLENYEQIPFILNEIQQLKTVAEEFRIRGGADIGRCPEEEHRYLSELVNEVRTQSNKLGLIWNKISADDNIYHYMVEINGTPHRLIQWADASNVDLEELRCGPWGSFVPGVPLTNLMHQVILRDAAVNKGLKLLDEVPERYIKND
jgi:sulfatase maturation enzyme AslB (radical SAM superfamily)